MVFTKPQSKSANPFLKGEYSAHQRNVYHKANTPSSAGLDSNRNVDSTGKRYANLEKSYSYKEAEEIRNNPNKFHGDYKANLAQMNKKTGKRGGFEHKSTFNWGQPVGKPRWKPKAHFNV